MLPLGYPHFATVWPFGLSREWIAVVWSYFDDSGSFNHTDFVCLAGYVAGEKEWDTFVSEWGAKLREHRVPFIHTKQIMHLQKPYDALGWSSEKRDEVVSDFISVIRKNVWAGFAVGVDVKFLRSLPEQYRRIIGKPEMLCFRRTMRLLTDKVNKARCTLPVYLTLDDSEQLSPKCYQAWSRLRREDAGFKERFASIAFADDEVFYPLQAADLLAHQSNFYLRSRLKGHGASREMGQLVKSHVEGFGIDYPSELWAEDKLRECISERGHNMARRS